MDFRKLQAFAKVYEMRSFSRAGEDLFLSQPTVSAHVASLEEELGVRLFDRLGRSVLPTQAAEVLYAAAHDVFTRLDGAVAEVRLLQDRVVGDLTVGGSTIPTHYILPELLAGFVRRHPDVRVHLVAGDSGGIVSQVASGRLAMGLVGADPEMPELEAVPVRDDELLVIGPAELIGQGGDPLRVLRAKPWVMREPGSGTRKAFEAVLPALGLNLRELRVVAWVESTEAVLRCARAGLGLGVVSRLAAAEGLERREFAALEGLPVHLDRRFYLVTRKGRTLSPAARAFAGFVTAPS